MTPGRPIALRSVKVQAGRATRREVLAGQDEPGMPHCCGFASVAAGAGDHGVSIAKCETATARQGATLRRLIVAGARLRGPLKHIGMAVDRGREADHCARFPADAACACDNPEQIGLTGAADAQAATPWRGRGGSPVCRGRDARQSWASDKGQACRPCRLSAIRGPSEASIARKQMSGIAVVAITTNDAAARLAPGEYLRGCWRADAIKSAYGTSKSCSDCP